MFGAHAFGQMYFGEFHEIQPLIQRVFQATLALVIEDSQSL